MQDYIKAIEELWQIRDSLNTGNDKYLMKKKLLTK